MERISFVTDDGVTIVGEYRAADGADKFALFLHAMPMNRASWASLAEALSTRGFSTLAIDLRGHGESTRGANGETLDYKNFSEDRHQEMIRDVEAGVRALMERGAVPARLALIGASIGANLSIVYAAAHTEIPAVVALSPGLDYHGVRTEGVVGMLPRSQKLLLVASSEDEYAAQSCVALAKANENAESHILENVGHGTEILERQAGFLQYVAEWVSNNIR
jgi:alpha-beta hydrolase superfamily lysophospholipase